MTDSVFNILSQKDFDEPSQITAVKAYVKRHYDEEVSLKLSGKDIIVFVPNSSLAGAMHVKSNKIREECGIEGRLVIRISS